MSFSSSIGLGGPEYKGNPFVKKTERYGESGPTLVQRVMELGRTAVEGVRDSASIAAGAVIDLAIGTWRDASSRTLDETLPIIEEDAA